MIVGFAITQVFVHEVAGREGRNPEDQKNEIFKPLQHNLGDYCKSS